MALTFFYSAFRPKIVEAVHTTGWRDLAILIARLTNASRREAGSLSLTAADRELKAAYRVRDILNDGSFQ